MNAAPERPWAFPRGTLRRFAETLAPGSRVANTRRLRGGLDAAMHALDLLLPDGERRRLVLRRHAATGGAETVALARRGWQMLDVLEWIGFPAPRGVWFDAEGALFGGPALAMTRLPGRGELRPRDHAAWVRGLAEALAALHATPLAGLDLAFLPGPEQTVAEIFARIERLGPRLLEHPDGAAVAAALALDRERVGARCTRPAAVLSHGDYWSGNTLWRRGRLCGVVDWDWARLAARGFDVSYCRLDMALLDGPGAADAFLQFYEAATGQAVADLAFWDLLAAARALPDVAVWLPGYLDFGRTDVTAESMRSRLRAFVAGRV